MKVSIEADWQTFQKIRPATKHVVSEPLYIFIPATRRIHAEHINECINAGLAGSD